MRVSKFAAALVVATVAVFAEAQVLNSDGFESSAYTAGQALDGQDGWIGFVSVGAAEVVVSEASTGRRAVRVLGGDLESIPTPGGSLIDGVWGLPIDFDPVAADRRLVRVEADVRLDGPDTGTGPGADLMSANFGIADATGQTLAFFFVSSNGSIYANAFSSGQYSFYEHESAGALGEYVHLTLVLDYDMHVATFEVEGESIGTLAFGVGQPTDEIWVPFFEMAALDEPQAVDPADYTAYLDNVSVQALPAAASGHGH